MHAYPETSLPLLLMRLWFAFSLSFGFLASLLGLVSSLLIPVALASGKEGIPIVYSAVLLLAPVSFLFTLVLAGRTRFVVPLELCGAGSFLAWLAGLYTHYSATYAVTVALGFVALTGFHFCRKRLLREPYMEMRYLLSIWLVLPLALSILFMSLDMDEMAFAPDSILPFGNGLELFALASLVLIPILFFSPGSSRFFILVFLILFLPFCAALAHETYSLVTEYLNDQHTIECGCTGPGDIYVAHGWKSALWGGLFALAFLAALLLLNWKAPGKSDSPA